MVDVSDKGATERIAVAEGRVIMRKQTLDLVVEGNAMKGDVLGAARLAGIMAAKRTHGLIPLCHPLPLTKIEIDINPEHALPGFLVQATVKVTGKTGVEMEALTAVSIACLTIYDMVKAVERGMRIEGIRLLHKSGGKSGEWRAETSPSSLMPVAEALRRVLADAKALPAEMIPLADALGRVLTDDVSALRTQPPAAVSAMDGYAVRASDIARAPVTLKLIGEVAAGHPFDGVVGEGQAARIFTGGVMPKGSDTVVIQELATSDGKTVNIQKASAKGRNVRASGIDFVKGQVLLPQGTRLSDRDLMLAAAMNHPRLSVHRQPKVAVLGTGDELVPPGSEPVPGQIVYSNGFALTALARSEGAAVFNLGIAHDRIGEITAGVRRAREWSADILVTTGGASVGEHDLVQQALASEGLDLSFWRVALRPGRPMMHGRLDGMQVLGLPGNPVSSYVCAYLFLVPLIRRLAGRRDTGHVMARARLGRGLPVNDERADYLRATLEDGADGPVATPLPDQDSSLMAPLARAGCLVIREPLAPAAEAGSDCVILKLGL